MGARVRADVGVGAHEGRRKAAEADGVALDRRRLLGRQRRGGTFEVELKAKLLLHREALRQHRIFAAADRHRAGHAQASAETLRLHAHTGVRMERASHCHGHPREALLLRCGRLDREERSSMRHPCERVQHHAGGLIGQGFRAESFDDRLQRNS